MASIKFELLVKKCAMKNKGKWKWKIKKCNGPQKYFSQNQEKYASEIAIVLIIQNNMLYFVWNNWMNMFYV